MFLVFAPSREEGGEGAELQGRAEEEKRRIEEEKKRDEEERKKAMRNEEVQSFLSTSLKTSTFSSFPPYNNTKSR